MVRNAKPNTLYVLRNYSMLSLKFEFMHSIGKVHIKKCKNEVLRFLNLFIFTYFFIANQLRVQEIK